jgi:hypothetical protein
MFPLLISSKKKYMYKIKRYVEIGAGFRVEKGIACVSF